MSVSFWVSRFYITPLLSHPDSCFPCSGLDVVIHTWTGAKHVCRHLRQTDWEKQEKKKNRSHPFIPLLHLSVYSSVFVCVSLPPTPTLFEFEWLMWLPSCCFDPGVSLPQGQCIPSPCLLNTILKSQCLLLPLSFTHTTTHTARQSRRERESSGPLLNLIEL